MVCNGIEECRVALLKARQGRAARQLHRGHGLRGRLHRRRGLPHPWRKDASEVDRYGREALEKTIGDALAIIGQK